MWSCGRLSVWRSKLTFLLDKWIDLLDKTLSIVFVDHSDRVSIRILKDFLLGCSIHWACSNQSLEFISLVFSQHPFQLLGLVLSWKWKFELLVITERHKVLPSLSPSMFFWLFKAMIDLFQWQAFTYLNMWLLRLFILPGPLLQSITLWLRYLVHSRVLLLCVVARNHMWVEKAGVVLNHLLRIWLLLTMTFDHVHIFTSLFDQLVPYFWHLFPTTNILFLGQLPHLFT